MICIACDVIKEDDESMMSIHDERDEMMRYA